MTQRPFGLIVPDQHDDDHDDFGGLHRDLLATGGSMGRRRALAMAAKWGAGLGASIGALSLLGCGASDITGSTTDTGTSTSGGTSTNSGATCPTRIPEATAGPYPGDGSNGANVLPLTGVVRQDIRSSFAGLSGTAAGVPLTIELTLVSAATCAALASYAVYLWHCDRAGNYSLYSAGATNQNWLRGVQGADSTGKLSFTSIFPGCYAGRWPHIHFEIYQSIAPAQSVRNKIATSQLALPKSACDLVYATSGYESSVRNLSGVSLASDNVFSDGSQLQIATMSGDVTSGFKAALTIGVNG